MLIFYLHGRTCRIRYGGLHCQKLHDTIARITSLSVLLRYSAGAPTKTHFIRALQIVFHFLRKRQAVVMLYMPPLISSCAHSKYISNVLTHPLLREICGNKFPLDKMTDFERHSFATFLCPFLVSPSSIQSVSF